MAKPIPHALTYEPRLENRDWPRIASRSLYGAGGVVWLLTIAGVYYFAITHSDDASDTPPSVPVWSAALFALIFGGVSGGIVASPIFGLGLIVRRFGIQIGERCRAPANWISSLLHRHRRSHDSLGKCPTNAPDDCSNAGH